MKIYTCTDHDTHYPVGGSSIVTAKDKREARKLLNEKLKEQGLSSKGVIL